MKGKKNMSAIESNSIEQMPGILKYHIQQKTLKKIKLVPQVFKFERLKLQSALLTESQQRKETVEQCCRKSHFYPWS